MDWTKLWYDFSKGDASAVQAIFSILGFIATVVGILYVVRSFNVQKKINEQQLKLNRLADAKDRREQFAMFIGLEDGFDSAAKTMKYSIYLYYNRVLDIEIFPISDTGNFKTPIYFPSQTATPSTSKPFHTFHINPLPEIVHAMGYKRLFLLYYTDQVGRPYTQDIGHNGEKCLCLYPQLQSTGFRNTLPEKRKV